MGYGKETEGQHRVSNGYGESLEPPQTASPTFVALRCMGFLFSCHCASYQLPRKMKKQTVLAHGGVDVTTLAVDPCSKAYRPQSAVGWFCPSCGVLLVAADDYFECLVYR